MLEFKIGAQKFDETARRQVEDYALDLHFFHAGSRNVPIIPVLIATDAMPAPQALPLLWHEVPEVFEANATTLASLLHAIAAQLPRTAIDIDAWELAPYRPIPNIVEAATMLYAKHGVADIKATRAEIHNLTNTTDEILSTVARTRQDGGHVILFVTGIPGAGKTLCGLNAVFGAETGAAFLTGNLPLVHVLREALALDAAKNGGKTLSAERRKAKSAIQPLTAFIKDNVHRYAPPHEHVIVFDEAQRAWDAAYGARKFALHDSEAALFLDIMRKHDDFAVIIALVGNGQEINTGEAGLSEWGRALGTRPDWKIIAAPGVLHAKEPRQLLFSEPPTQLRINPVLHLDVPVRQIRSIAAAGWVDAVLRGDVTEAQKLAQAGIPFFITRALPEMRRGLKSSARGERRAGLVCSTGARQLVADGIWPDFPHLDETAIANWFLKRWPDVRSSEALKIPATQFACQGLELDHVGLCWGGDLIWNGT